MGKNKKEYINIWGVRIRGDIFVALIIFLIGFVLFGVRTYKLKYGKTKVVYAEIIDVGIKNQPGLGIHTIGYSDYVQKMLFRLLATIRFKPEELRHF